MPIDSGRIVIWYHDESEVDKRYSWLSNSTFLVNNAETINYADCSYSKILALTEYARPDFILSVDGEPLLSAELTEMNPSGHNMPQRFSCLLRAAEIGIPSLFYYPEYARRTASDPNPRYLNVRVPLAQLRLSEIYQVPSVSLFWPTDPNTLFPTNDVTAHKPFADFVEYIARKAIAGGTFSMTDPEYIKIQNAMKVAATPREPYRENPSFRKVFPNGDSFTKSIVSGGNAIDPPTSCSVENTHEYLSDLFRDFGKRLPKNKKTGTLLKREYTFVYKGVPNQTQTGPEHPYPGYLTLLDVLYLRTPNGQTTRDRSMNLAFELPITLEKYIENAINRPVGLNIIMEFADIIILSDAIVLGGWIRNLYAGAVLIRGV